MYTTITYLVYVTISLAMTIWVGRVLFKNGRIFVIEAFGGNEGMGDSVNHLLITGFYLINLGFVALFLSYGQPPQSGIEAIQFISTKIGVVLIVLAALHYFNIFNFARLRQKRHNTQHLVNNGQGSGNGGQNVPHHGPKRERPQTLPAQPVRAQAQPPATVYYRVGQAPNQPAA
jgi:hypothetical protein